MEERFQNDYKSIIFKYNSLQMQTKNDATSHLHSFKKNLHYKIKINTIK